MVKSEMGYVVILSNEGTTEERREMERLRENVGEEKLIKGMKHGVYLRFE